MSDWRKLYTAAVLETDPSRLILAIAEAENAMENRLNESVLPAERQEIANAATALVVLKSERELWIEGEVDLKN